MENDILKQAALIMDWCGDVIRNKSHKYSVSAMCDVLQIPRSIVVQFKPTKSTCNEFEIGNVLNR